MLCTADLAITPSRPERFGLTVLEAFAGLPFLVTQASGFGEAQQDVLPQSTSWFVDSEESEKWAEAIKSVKEKGREAAIAECQTPRKAMARSTSGRVNAGILWKRWSASLMVSTFQYISCESCHGNSDFRFGCKSKPTYLVPHFISKGFRYAEGKRIYTFLFYTVLMIHFCY